MSSHVYRPPPRIDKPKHWLASVPTGDVVAATLRGAINTTTGLQTFTTTKLNGLTPKAAIVIITRATTDATAVDGYDMSIGLVDGIKERMIVFQTQHNVATTNTKTQTLSSALVEVNQPGTDTDDVQINFSKFVTNGIEIDIIDNVTNTAYLMTAILFAGDDLKAYVDSFSPSASVDTGTDVTAPGFQPDVIFAIGSRTDTVGSGSGHANVSIGVCHYDGVSTITQRAIATSATQGVTNGNIGGALSSDRILEWPVNNASAVNNSIEITDVDSVGFTATTRDAGASEDMLYMALNFGGLDAYVGTYTTPTATGNNANTAPGFKPQLLMFGLTHLEALDTYNNTGLGSVVGVTAIDDTDSYTNIVAQDDGSNPTDNQSLSDDRAIVVPDETGTLDIEATLVTLDSSGYTLNYTNAPATAKLFWVLAIEAPSGPVTYKNATATIAATGDITQANGTAIRGRTATIAATGDITQATPNKLKPATATISATGDITQATGIRNAAATATIAATGDITQAAPSKYKHATASILATGDITQANGAKIKVGTATISAHGDITQATGIRNAAATATIAATGDITQATPNKLKPATATINATGDITQATGIRNAAGTATISAHGDISQATPTVLVSATATISASGDITQATPSKTKVGSATIAATGDITQANATAIRGRTATISAHGDITQAAPSKYKHATASIAASGDITQATGSKTGGTVKDGTATISATADITQATPQVVFNAAATLSATGDITQASGTAIRGRTATISATADITQATPTVLVSASATISATGDITQAAPTVLVSASATINATGDITQAQAQVLVPASATISSTADLVAVGIRNAAATSTITATANLAGIGTATRPFAKQHHYAITQDYRTYETSTQLRTATKNENLRTVTIEELEPIRS